MDAGITATDETLAKYNEFKMKKKLAAVVFKIDKVENVRFNKELPKIDKLPKNEYKETGVIEQAHLIPLSTLSTDYVNLPKDEDIYIFCKGGGRALTAMSFLQRAGYYQKLVIMKGGMSQTIKEEYPLAKYSEKKDDDDEEDDDKN